MFSVVMPIFNKRQHVVPAIRSVLDQSWADFELILVDDGSTDDSYEAAARISDPRLKLVRQKNAGVASARNHGIRLATRAWVAFIDADDLWFEAHLDELYRIVEALPRSGLVATNYTTGLVAGMATPPTPRPVRALNYFQEASKNVGIVWTSAVAARRDSLKEVGCFPLVGSGEDLACWAALALRYPVGYSERVTAFYRLETGGIMDQTQRNPLPTDMPQCLAKVSPSVRFLLERSSEIEAGNLRTDVSRYIASRIEAAIRGEFAAGAFARGKRWAALGGDYVPHFRRSTRFSLLLPDWLLRPAWLARRGVRHLFSKV